MEKKRLQIYFILPIFKSKVLIHLGSIRPLFNKECQIVLSISNMASLSLYNSQVHLESVYPLHCKQNVCFFKILFQLYIPEDPVAVKTSIRNGNPNNLVNQSKPKEYALNINSISSPSLFLSLCFSLFFFIYLVFAHLAALSMVYCLANASYFLFLSCNFI